MYASPYAPQTRPSALVHESKRSLDIEIPLYETHTERDLCDSLAELYSILMAINCLERAYIKDEFANQEDYYTSTTTRLLKQYSLILENDKVAQEYKDIDAFTKRFALQCPLAVRRVTAGLPATTDNLQRKAAAETVSTDNADNGRAIAEATGAFITLMDAIKLDYNTKEQLHPLLSDIVTSTNKVYSDYEGRAKLVQWLIQLNGMALEDTLNEVELKEFLWDVDTAYKGFYAKLG